MIEPWLEEAVKACGLEPPSSFPRDLMAQLPWLPFPAEAVGLPGLSPEAMRAWLARRGIRRRVFDDSHGLKGCMVADHDRRCIVFYDNRQERSELRFTIAHELSHFVLEEWLPRRKASRVLGDPIRAVFDGERAPTTDESVTALFERVPLGPPVDLMARDAVGHYANQAIIEAEHRADRMALELLAPAEFVLPLVADVSEDEARGRLVFSFGLPWDMARAHVVWLRERLRAPRFSIDSFLGQEGE
ncbi:ImmA/IrrE family metallo-endopeptidase [Myxococcus sp. K15C18031901]|uniref:ImmA/IrrE family metallo-endopeptidase n=1 Tax=Myxococcus dinghuensis TaxID=2906761 RepID=UPI0020A71467|nr:ImmA/IrrE family metallo-endopeptidase [Myxococcus dinghuensis]MCP3098441.1 ImmA/IrrE family metallo-endopeptidase [Myxococcus dinghuensis]